MLPTVRPPLFQHTDPTATMAAIRVPEAMRSPGLAPTTPPERQDRHGSGLEGRPQRGETADLRHGDGDTRQPRGMPPARIAPISFAAYLAVQQVVVQSAAPAFATAGTGTGIAAYRSAQALARRTETDGAADAMMPFPKLASGRTFDLRI